MAVAGDVVIKLAADVAELKAGMAEATAKLDEFGKAAAQTGEKLDGMASGIGSALKGLSAGAVIGLVINELKSLAQAAEKSSLEIAKQAGSLKVSAEQFQVYKLAADQAGTSVEEATKQLRGNADATDRLTRYYKDLGLVIDNETVAKFARMNAAAEESQRRIEAIIAPLYAAAKETILDAIANTLQRIKDIVATTDYTKLSTLLSMAMLALNPAMVIGPALFGPDPKAVKLDELNTQLAETVRHLADLRSGAANPMPMIGREQEIAMYEKKLAELQLARAKLTSPVATFPPLTVAAPADKPHAGGGGGKTDAESMDEQIKRYQALGAAATKAYTDIKDKHFTLVEDVQRELRVQQQVEQIAARLGAKYSDASKEQKAMLHDAVEGWERAKEASAEYVRQLQAAEDINARFGGGTAARDRIRRESERARAGGVDPKALERYNKQAEEARRQQELNAQRFDDDLGAVGAGFQSAMERYARAHDMFASGEASFEALSNSMGEAFETLAGRSSKSFEQIAADFATMLSKIAMQMAISEAFKWLIKIGSAYFGDVSAAAGPAGGYSATLNPDTGMTTLTPRAGGGAVEIGQRYRVGEYGPETFVPQAVGKIEPASANGGGSNVTVNVDMKKAEGARDPSSALEFGRRVKAAVMGVIEDEKRPGGTLYRNGAPA